MGGTEEVCSNWTLFSAQNINFKLSLILKKKINCLCLGKMDVKFNILPQSVYDA